MASPIRPLSFASNDAGRQSPFRRQHSASQATTVRATTPTSSPTKGAPTFSPVKQSPFVRRPSQINGNGSDRPVSPFARPTSGLSLGVPGSPSRSTSRNSVLSKSDDAEEEKRPLPEPTRRATPPGPARAVTVEREETPVLSPPTPSRALPSPSSMFDEPQVDSPKTAIPSQANLRPAAARESTPTFAPSSPVREAQSPSPFDGPTDSPPAAMPSQASLRPAFNRIPTSSTVSTIRQPTFTSASVPSRPAPKKQFSNSVSGYQNVPQTLLRSMRESFEVLDSNNTGVIDSAAVQTMLEQMGMPSSNSDVRDFFPPNTASNLNLARYLDILSGPLAELSDPEELTAAFEAFDVDDSGQIDVGELRRALLETAPDDLGSERMSEREVDSILGEFASRRHFGAKGLNVAKGKGEVFRYREFMASISGGGGDAGAGVEQAMAA